MLSLCSTEQLLETKNIGAVSDIIEALALGSDSSNVATTIWTTKVFVIACRRPSLTRSIDSVKCLMRD